MSERLLDAAGRRRSPATLPGFHAGRPPRNKGMRYPADPPTRRGDRRRHARRRRERPRAAPACPDRRAVARRTADQRGARARREPISTRAAARCWCAAARAVAAARSAWTTGPGSSSQPWLTARLELPVGPLFCVISGPTRGRRWSISAARAQLRDTAAAAGVRRRFAPHQLRHAHAVELAHEGVPLVVIQRQLGHSNLGITSVYLQGIDNAEIIETVHARRAPMVPVQVTLEPLTSRALLIAQSSSRRGSLLPPTSEPPRRVGR